MVTRFTEPPRPDNYQELPRFSGEKYWRNMARAIKVIRPGVVEIPHYRDQRLRLIGLYTGCFLLMLIIGVPIYQEGSFTAWQQEMVDGYEFVFHFDERTRQRYRKRQHAIGHRITEEEYLKTPINRDRHYYRFFKTYGFYLWFGSLALICFGVFLFYPYRCPVRFDRDREIAYTWYRKQLYIADIGPFLAGLDTRPGSDLPDHPVRVLRDDTTVGPLLIRMHPIDTPAHKRQFWIGTYPPTHANQNLDIDLFISAFMSKYHYNTSGQHEPWSDTWLQKLQLGRPYPLDCLRRLGSHTFGHRCRFDETKTDDLLLEYLTHPSTQNRGRPL